MLKMSISASPSDNNNSNLLYVGFNQDAGCFAVGMESGFRVFNTDPLKQKEKMDFPQREGSGVGFVEMLFRTNFLGILGGGNTPKMKPNMSMIWDDLKKKFVIEFEYSSDIRAIRLRRDRIVLILDTVVKVYTFEPLPQLVQQFDTGLNPLGLGALCQASKLALFAFPGKKPGVVELVDIGNGDRPSMTVEAHNSELAALSLNQQGAKMATASEKGTLIRIFNTENKELLYELRRGANQAIIYNIAFNPENTMVCASSDHGTVHIFKLEGEKEKTQTSRSRAQSLLPKYFNSHVSDVRLNLRTKGKAICAFSTATNNAIIVLGADGSYNKYTINSQGSAILETTNNFLEFDDDNHTD